MNTLTVIFQNTYVASERDILLEWYENNYLKPNPDKWHLIL